MQMLELQSSLFTKFILKTTLIQQKKKYIYLQIAKANLGG